MPDSEPSRLWKIASAVIVIAIAIGVYWIIERASAPPPAPAVKLPYEPPSAPAQR